MNLPNVNEVAIVDPVAVKAWRLAAVPIEAADVLSSIVDTGDQLAVTGTGDRRVALLDEITGEVERSASVRPPDRRLFIEAAWYISQSPSGDLLLTADGPGVGYVFKLDAQTLRYKGRARIGFGQNGFAYDTRGRLWTLGVEGEIGIAATTVSIVDVDSMSSEIKILRGYPTGIVSGPRKHMFVSMRGRNGVVELSLTGDAVDHLKVGERPSGIDIGPGGIGVVVALSRESSYQTPAVYIVDFERMQILDSVELGDSCPDAREVIILRDRAAVACAALPGIVVVDLAERQIAGTLTFPTPRRSEEPRGLAIVEIAR